MLLHSIPATNPYLLSDHSVRLGLSFDSKEPAEEFHNHLVALTSDPANTGLKGPTVANTKTHYYLDNVPQKKPQRPKSKPNKMDISQPCGFQHVVSVSQSDFQKYFSLQTFVNKSFDEAKKALANGARPQRSSLSFCPASADVFAKSQIVHASVMDLNAQMPAI